MPIKRKTVTMSTTRGVTVEQKKRLISGTSELLQTILNKEPGTTHVVIDEVDTDNWGVGHESVTQMRTRMQLDSKAEQEQVLQK